MAKSIKIQEKIYQNPLYVFAMKIEAGNEFLDKQVIFTGIGKINATYTLSKAIFQIKPDLIINLGTAGSNIINSGEIANCTGFVQRDMDVRPLGFEKYQTPFSEEEIILRYGIHIDNFPEYICGTGDSFETSHLESIYQVVDMEAYSLAFTARKEKIPFLCLKYLSDGADNDAVSNWNEEVKKAPKKLAEILNSL